MGHRNHATVLLQNPGAAYRGLRDILPAVLKGQLLAQNWASLTNGPAQQSAPAERSSASAPNPLEVYFETHQVGRGIWKWKHYFDIYHRHFQKFIGSDVHILEVGIYSGGSLDMWRHYFGPKAKIYGVDIEEACKSYESNGTRVFVGDQGDRSFWRRILREVPRIDVLIDDGGHLPHEQIVTLEETLPFLSPGGVFLCEDIHGRDHEFTAYVSGVVDRLNEWKGKHLKDLHAAHRSLFQRSIHSIHFYPFVVVIEKTSEHVDAFEAPRRGTEWQPFLSVR